MAVPLRVVVLGRLRFLAHYLEICEHLKQIGRTFFQSSPVNEYILQVHQTFMGKQPLQGQMPEMLESG